MTKPPTTDWSINTPLYKLVASRLGQSPIEYILAERALTPPTPYAKIAERIRNTCNSGQPASTHVELTHEAPRRWHVRYLNDMKAVAEAREAKARVA
jgi:hypothetical protein